MAKKDTLARLGAQICSDYLGFSPTSNGTKPPHIANGLFRCCTGETCDTQSVHSWIVHEGRKNAVTSEDIVEQFEAIFEKGYRENAENVKAFRYLLSEIFNQDNTVYPSYDFSVMTQTSHWMIKKRISNEAGIGEFLFDILAKELNGTRSPALDCLRQALSYDADDLTKLIKPILAYPSEDVKCEKTDVEYPLETAIQWDTRKETLRHGFDRLAINMRKMGETKNSLLVLRRFVTFSMFATLLYLSQVNSAKYGVQAPPIVIDSGCELESIKKASEQSYIAAKKAVEDYFVNVLEDILAEEIPQATNTSCIQWIDNIIASGAKDEEIRKAVSSYYEGFFAAQEKPLRALAKALQIALYTFEYKNNSPSDFCRVLGVRGGLVGPKGNRAAKRYLINSFTLETIILSILDSDSLDIGIELKELSQRLMQSYNMIMGADADTEYAILEQAQIAQSTPGDLRGDLSINAQMLANTLISLGLGKKYADGVTLIGWRL